VTTVLYLLAVLTPLVLAGISLTMIAIRWIERRAEDRVRAEHGLPPRPTRPTRRIEDDEPATGTGPVLRRRLTAALDPDAGAREAVPARPAPRPPSDLPWPLEGLGTADPVRRPDAEPIHVTRAVPEPTAAPVVPAEPAVPRRIDPPAPPAAEVLAAVRTTRLPPEPDRDLDGARAALARAAATLQELERAADQADRHGTKDCPECLHSVRLAARVCPHCRHRMVPEPGPGVTAV